MPRHRKILSETGSMQNITTNQLSFTPKVAKRTEMIMPCGHIRTAKQPLDGKTTTALSFVNPGPTDQIQNYKPALKYCKLVQVTKILVSSKRIEKKCFQK